MVSVSEFEKADLKVLYLDGRGAATGHGKTVWSEQRILSIGQVLT